MALDGPHLASVVATELCGYDPVPELVAAELRRFEGQLLWQVAAIVADVERAVLDQLEEREDVLLSLDHAGGAELARVVELEGDVRRTVQNMVAPVAVLVEALVEDRSGMIAHRQAMLHVVLDLFLHGEGRVLDLGKFDVELAAPDPFAEGLALHLRELELVLLIAVGVFELGRVNLVETVGNQNALQRDRPGHRDRLHPRGPARYQDPGRQGPFLFARRELAVLAVADVVILPVDQREGVFSLVAQRLDWNQLFFAGSGAGLVDVVVNDRLTGLIQKVAGWQLGSVETVALNKEVANAKEIVHDCPVISLTNRDVGLVLVVLQAGVKLTEILVL